jgi:hypothetical protein
MKNKQDTGQRPIYSVLETKTYPEKIEGFKTFQQKPDTQQLNEIINKKEKE